MRIQLEGAILLKLFAEGKVDRFDQARLDGLVLEGDNLNGSGTRGLSIFVSEAIGLDPC